MFLQGEGRLSVQDKDYLSGDQFGSYFGYDLAIIDLDRDGWVWYY